MQQTKDTLMVANEIEITALLFLTYIIFRNNKGGTKGRSRSRCLCPAWRFRKVLAATYQGDLQEEDRRGLV